jgi:hypothetical protein
VQADGKLLETRNSNGNTPLMMAASESVSKVQCCVRLLEAKANPDQRSAAGKTAFQMAADEHVKLVIQDFKNQSARAFQLYQRALYDGRASVQRTSKDDNDDAEKKTPSSDWTKLPHFDVNLVGLIAEWVTYSRDFLEGLNDSDRSDDDS